jgi:eukaryotic-like serine/threonine-protein kinase
MQADPNRLGGRAGVRPGAPVRQWMRLASSEHFTRASTLDGRSAATLRAPARDRRAIPRQVGRYVLERELGRGAFGNVHAGHDPELHRAVAVKILMSDLDDDSARARQVREGRALAQLAHPNVVTVYDVGVVESTGQIYLAMELVDGPTLRDWLRTPRTIPEIVDAFRQAAAGLAAAHAVELVHRDFKPSNVLLTADGIAKVADFGLARPVRSLSTGHDRAGSGELAGVNGLPDVTATGDMMGTPGYMPPEVIRGGEWTPAGDQFSYCVALYEALYGRRPFEGESWAVLAANVVANRRRPAPRLDVPQPLARALERGLEPDAEQRFASMNDLLAALAPRRSWQSRRLWPMLGLGAAALGLALASEAPPVGIEACERAASTALWGDGAASPRLDGAGRPWATRWRAEYEALCRTMADEQRSVRVDQQRQCLEALATRFRETIATRDSSDLPDDPTSCRDEAKYAIHVPKPPAELAEREAELRARVESGDAPHDPETLPRLRALLPEVRALGHDPLTVDILYAIALAELFARQAESAVRNLEEASERAMASGYTVAVSWIEAELCRAIAIEGVDAGALRHCDHAEALARRLDRPDLEGRAIAQRARVHRQHGRHHQAREDLERAVVLTEGAVGPLDHATLTTKGNLANTLWDLGDLRASLELQREVAAGFAAAYGEDHPATLSARHNIAASQLELGEFDDAEAMLRRSLEKLEAIHGPNHPNLLNEVLNLFELELRRSNFDQAREHLERAKRIDLGDDLAARRLRLSLAQREAELASNLGATDDTERIYRSVIDEATALFGARSDATARAHYELGHMLLLAGRKQRATLHLEHTIEILAELDLADTPTHREAVALLAGDSP